MTITTENTNPNAQLPSKKDIVAAAERGRNAVQKKYFSIVKPDTTVSAAEKENELVRKAIVASANLGRNAVQEKYFGGSTSKKTGGLSF